MCIRQQLVYQLWYTFYNERKIHYNIRQSVNSFLFAYGDFYFLYLYITHCLFGRLVLLLCSFWSYVTEMQPVCFYSGIKKNKSVAFVLGTVNFKQYGNSRFIIKCIKHGACSPLKREGQILC